jgi:putative SOS response-associated peptidase YedK
MCGRYVRKSTRREIAAWFAADDAGAPPWAESYNVAPQTFQPIVRRNRESGAREIALLRWGLIPYWAKDAKIGYRTINAKAETVATAPAFRDAFKRRRCLVPADAFYEWQALDAKHKQPFAIALTSREPYGFAGLWERWQDPATQQTLETFSIITTDANALVAPLHSRMPVILEPRDYDRWLDTTTTPPPTPLLRSITADPNSAWKVDKAVGNVRNDRPDLLAPAAEVAAEDESQTGLFDGLFPPG